MIVAVSIPDCLSALEVGSLLLGMNKVGVGDIELISVLVFG